VKNGKKDVKPETKKRNNYDLDRAPRTRMASNPSGSMVPT
jgi:hypothetical protein